MMNANTVLSSISENRALWLSQYHAEVRERNRISDLDEASRKGFEKGERNMLSKMKELSEQGLSVEDILRQLELQ